LDTCRALQLHGPTGCNTRAHIVPTAAVLMWFQNSLSRAINKRGFRTRQLNDALPTDCVASLTRDSQQAAVRPLLQVHSEDFQILRLEKDLEPDAHDSLPEACASLQHAEPRLDLGEWARQELKQLVASISSLCVSASESWEESHGFALLPEE
jgi:hypothetical protein